jgi:exosortase/archaeosortase family protein
VQTATAGNPNTSARNFALRGVAWTLALFALLRVAWFEGHAVLPLTQWQGRLAADWFGAPPLPVAVTLACSGADAIALCAGAILAYPATWRARLAGVGGGLTLILALNVVRIGTLGRAVASPAWFTALHVYLWPALLTVAIAGYAFNWMRLADRRRERTPTTADATALASPSRRDTPAPSAGLTPWFVLLTVVFLVIFTAAAPWYLESAGVLAVGAFIARSAAAVLRGIGIPAVAAGNVLTTPRAILLVTQECISTPLIPVYLAATCAYAGTWRQRALCGAATIPLFVALGIARLLVVALPAALIGSPLFLIHAFYQLLLGAVVVLLAALWRHGGAPAAWLRAFGAAALGGVCVYLLAAPYAHGIAALFSSGAPLDDPQGAIALLPAFQAGLYVALAVAAFAQFRWRPFAIGLALIGVSQVIAFTALHAWVRHAGLIPHVRDVRAWALAGPVLLIAMMVSYERPRR